MFDDTRGHRLTGLNSERPRTGDPGKFSRVVEIQSAHSVCCQAATAMKTRLKSITSLSNKYSKLIIGNISVIIVYEVLMFGELATEFVDGKVSF